GLWIPTSLYAFGYMRGHHEKNQTRFFVCFAIAIFAALGIGLATQLHWLESFRTFAAPIAIPLCLLSGILFSLAELPFFCAWRHLRIE
ncbi:MAG: hypothetical protein QF391_11105, partial [Myxococcota bacterium]|nr:hypothetical protein [Myxococcota bacterium]